MNIDYAAIIEKANQRKDNLQALTALLEEAPRMYDALLELKHWASDVRNAYVVIDNECRELLPPTLKLALEWVDITVDNLDKARVNNRAGLFYLLPGDPL